MEFIRIFLHAVFFIFQHLKEFCRSLAIPFLLTILIDFLSSDSQGTFTFIGLFILTLLVDTIIAVTSHRIILLGPNSVPKWGIVRTSQRELRFFMYMFALSFMVVPIVFIVGFLPSIILNIFPNVLIFISMTLFVFIFIRLSLVFPAIAVDKPITFKQSWDFTKNYKLLMFLVVFVLPLSMAIIVLLVDLIPYTLIINSLLSTLLVVITICSLSLTYKKIVEHDFDS